MLLQSLLFFFQLLLLLSLLLPPRWVGGGVGRATASSNRNWASSASGSV